MLTSTKQSLLISPVSPTSQQTTLESAYMCVYCSKNAHVVPYGDIFNIIKYVFIKRCL